MTTVQYSIDRAIENIIERKKTDDILNRANDIFRGWVRKIHEFEKLKGKEFIKKDEMVL